MMRPQIYFRKVVFPFLLNKTLTLFNSTCKMAAYTGVLMGMGKKYLNVQIALHVF